MDHKELSHNGYDAGKTGRKRRCHSRHCHPRGIFDLQSMKNHENEANSKTSQSFPKACFQRIKHSKGKQSC